MAFRACWMGSDPALVHMGPRCTWSFSVHGPHQRGVYTMAPHRVKVEGRLGDGTWAHRPRRSTRPAGLDWLCEHIQSGQFAARPQSHSLLKDVFFFGVSGVCRQSGQPHTQVPVLHKSLAASPPPLSPSCPSLSSAVPSKIIYNKKETIFLLFIYWKWRANRRIVLVLSVMISLSVNYRMNDQRDRMYWFLSVKLNWDLTEIEQPEFVGCKQNFQLCWGFIWDQMNDNWIIVFIFTVWSLICLLEWIWRKTEAHTQINYSLVLFCQCLVTNYTFTLVIIVFLGSHLISLSFRVRDIHHSVIITMDSAHFPLRLQPANQPNYPHWK